MVLKFKLLEIFLEALKVFLDFIMFNGKKEAINTLWSYGVIWNIGETYEYLWVVSFLAIFILSVIFIF